MADNLRSNHMTNQSQNNKTTSGTLLVFIATLGLLSILPIAFWDGFVAETLWRWFVVPLRVMPIGIWDAAGLFVLIQLFVWNKHRDSSSSSPEGSTPFSSLMIAIMESITVPAFALLFGFIYHLFM